MSSAKNLQAASVFFLDIQTTGASPKQGHVLEMAWAHGDQAIHHSLVKLPEGEKLPRPIQALTGLRPEDLVDALPLAQVLENLDAFLNSISPAERPLAIIHFASFERKFLDHIYQTAGREIPFDILCTHEIAKRLLPNLPTRGIKGLAGYFGYHSGEVKRAGNYVEATRFIWQGLVHQLAQKEILQLEDLRQWLVDTPKVARTKYEYPMAKEKRLSLPDQPGIYRMISKTGEVLYVGKATSLRDRVNSYFRGQKNRDPRKLEMLTQAWDLRVTLCESILEASLLETDEIKRLNPPYNISLKTGQRQLAYFAKDFSSRQSFQDEIHNLGPFSNALIFDSLQKLVLALQEGVFSPLTFFEPMDPVLIESGFDLFCQRHGFTRSSFSSLRDVLAVGLKWFRQQLKEEPSLEEQIESTEEEVREEELELTSEELADKFERHFIRGGANYTRARKLTRLLNSDIEFQEFSTTGRKRLVIRSGRIISARETAGGAAILGSVALSVETYDRMSVLNTELEKIKNHQGQVWITSRFVTKTWPDPGPIIE